MYLLSSKGDQEGTKHIDHPWHLHTVSTKLIMCLVPAFEKYLMCHPEILNGEHKMFDGSSTYEWMNTVLKDVVHAKEHYKEFAKLSLISQSLWGQTQSARVQSNMEHGGW